MRKRSHALGAAVVLLQLCVIHAVQPNHAGAVPALYLPYPAGKTYQVTQGHGGSFSHFDRANRYATDFAMSHGEPVLASASGKVIVAGDKRDDYGLQVVIQHAPGQCTRYTHLSTIAVSLSQQVGQAQLIGAVGSTGRSTAPHLHFDLNNCSYTSVDSRFAEYANLVPAYGHSLTSRNGGTGVTRLSAAVTLSDPQGGHPINTQPLRKQRPMHFQVFNVNNQLTFSGQGTASHIAGTNKYLGRVDLPSGWSSGQYQVKVRLDYSLWRVVPGIPTILAGTETTLPSTPIIVGDVNESNAVNITDYNLLMNCYSDLTPARGPCSAAQRQAADIYDDGDGAVNQYDYNLYLRISMNQQGG